MLVTSTSTERYKMKKIEHIFDIETGETTIVERDETKDEKEIRLAIEAEAKANEAAAAAKAEAKAELLAKLGITEDEAKLLLS